MTSLKATVRALACMLATVGLGAVQAATITVGPGQSIQAAVDTAVAGDTVRVLAGTYNKKVLISKSGTAGALITLKGDPGAIISGAGLGTVEREGLITIRNANYVRVEGFDLADFKAGRGKTPVGILFEGHGKGVQIVNNKIHGIKNTTTCVGCSEGAHGLGVFGTDTTGIADLLVQGNEVYGNVLQFSEALVINGNVDGFEVLNNDVHDNNNIGFVFIGYEDECAGCGELDRARNGMVRGNKSRNNTSRNNPAYAGDTSADGYYVDGGHHIIFDRNLASGNDVGFEFASEHKGKATEDILMTNNFVYRNGAGVSVGGYDKTVGTSRRITVNNNAFYKNMGWSSEVALQFGATNVSFNNNIFFGKGAMGNDVDTLGTGNTGITWGTNLWWGVGGSAARLPGIRVVADPRFVAPDSGDLNLQAASPAIDAGTTGAPITGWTAAVFTRYFPSGAIPANGTADYAGDARVQGNIDLGADEYGGTPAAKTAPAAQFAF